MTFIHQAISALKNFDRRTACRFMAQALAQGARTGADWRSVSQLAAHIGEVDLELEAARRYAATMPYAVERVIYYANLLSRLGRGEEADAALSVLPSLHPAVLHLRGVIAARLGKLEKAEDIFRHALTVTPVAPQIWAALTELRRFRANDPDIAKMEALLPVLSNGPAEVRAQFFYALGKGYDDCGDVEKAISFYQQGAKLMRRAFDAASLKEAVHRTRTDFPEANTGFRPSTCESERVIFVTGLPRSGTTLVQQILLSHPDMKAGAELNFVHAALIPTAAGTRTDAEYYQKREMSDDPWGDLARDYLDMIDQRFGTTGRIIDKTTGQSRHLGLLLHMLPRARIVWVRRSAEDCALSCYRTFFSFPMAWSWDLADIAAWFRAEDQLYAHWSQLYPDQILTVPYEELVSNPGMWRGRIAAHVGLSFGDMPDTHHHNTQTVTTASIAQVRAPISTSRVGAASAYGDFMTPFRQAYYD